MSPPKSNSVHLLVSADGIITIYDDDVNEALRDLGPTEIRRASHVEPTVDGQWQADMTPIAGDTVVLGQFGTRQQALDAEVEWLQKFLSSEEDPCRLPIWSYRNQGPSATTPATSK